MLVIIDLVLVQQLRNLVMDIIYRLRYIINIMMFRELNQEIQFMRLVRSIQCLLKVIVQLMMSFISW